MRFLIIFTLLFNFNCYCTAKDLYDNAGDDIYKSLSDMEWQIYRKDYANDDLKARIDRLENSIFGQKSNYTLYYRLNALKKAMKTNKDRYLSINKQVILDLLENRYFSQTYKTEPLETRLGRLEMRIFGEISTDNVEERFKHLTENIPL